MILFYDPVTMHAYQTINTPLAPEVEAWLENGADGKSFIRLDDNKVSLRTVVLTKNEDGSIDLSEREPPPPEDIKLDIETVRFLKLTKIDHEAERMRSKFLTLRAGQALVYLEKRRESEAFLLSAKTKIPTPHLAAEAFARGTDLATVANLVRERSEAWAEVSPKIEAARITAKVAIAAAKTPEEIDAVQVDWGQFGGLPPDVVLPTGGRMAGDIFR